MSSQPPALELDDLISELRGGGDSVQSGSFTLDSKKAEAKLKNFRLANPAFYILKVVQSAVASGAGRIAVDCGPTSVELLHDGEPPAGEMLEGLLGFVLDESGRPEVRAIKHLATGVHASLAVEPRVIRVQVWDGESGVEHEWKAGGSKHRDWNPDTEFREQWKVRFYLSQELEQVVSRWGFLARLHLGDLFGQRRSALTPEAGAIYDRCAYTPAEIMLNGRPLDNGHFGKPAHSMARSRWHKLPPDPAMMMHNSVHRSHHLVECYYQEEDSATPGIGLPRFSHAQRCLSPDFPKDARCKAWLAMEAAQEPAARISFVEDGVTLCQSSFKLPYDGLVGVVNAATLKKDLSGFALVENENYAKQRLWLEEKGEELSQALGSAAGP